MSVERCLEAIRRGNLVALPTDTFYALSCDPRNATALAELRRLKQAPEGRPWPLLLPRGYDLERLACHPDTRAQKFMGRFWPGPLTIIMSCDGPLGRLAGRAPDGALGLREPAGPSLLLDTLTRFDGPLVGTSANRSGSRPAQTQGDVLKAFPRFQGYVAPGTSPGGMASTVVDLTAPEWCVVRSGPISDHELRACLT